MHVCEYVYGSFLYTCICIHITRRKKGQTRLPIHSFPLFFFFFYNFCLQVEEAELIVRKHIPLLVSNNLRVRMIAKQKAVIEIDETYINLATQLLPIFQPVFSELGFTGGVSVRAFASGSLSRGSTSSNGNSSSSSMVQKGGAG